MIFISNVPIPCRASWPCPFLHLSNKNYPCQTAAIPRTRTPSHCWKPLHWWSKSTRPSHATNHAPCSNVVTDQTPLGRRLENPRECWSPTTKLQEKKNKKDESQRSAEIKEKSTQEKKNKTKQNKGNEKNKKYFHEDEDDGDDYFCFYCFLKSM